jgi:hypothetical protein
MLSVFEIRQILVERDREAQNPWSVWVGADKNTATRLLNFDGSNPYLRQIAMTNEAIAFDTTLKIASELYRLTWVHQDEPSANWTYWLSEDAIPESNSGISAVRDDLGFTLERIQFSYRQSRCQKAYWWIFLKNSN